MKQRKPWAVEQKELEEQGFRFNNRGELLQDEIPVTPISVAPIIRDIIKKQESKPVVVKKLMKKEKRRM